MPKGRSGMYAVTFTVPTSWAGATLPYSPAAFLAISVPSTRNGPLRPADIEVDFQTSAPAKSMSGLLMGDDVGKPPVDRISPLEPRLYRAGSWSHLWAGNGASWPQLYTLYRGLGARVQLILGDTWNNSEVTTRRFHSRIGPNGRRMSGRSRGTTRVAICSGICGTNRTCHRGREPANNFSKPICAPTKCCVQNLGRACSSADQVSAPVGKVGGESKGFIVGLLDYCRLHGCEVNFISWHNFDDTNNGIPALADRRWTSGARRSTTLRMRQ